MTQAGRDERCKDPSMLLAVKPTARSQVKALFNKLACETKLINPRAGVYDPACGLDETLLHNLLNETKMEVPDEYFKGA